MKNQRHNERLMCLVATKLKELREAKAITQAQAYQLSGIHLGRVESGNANITVSTLSALCKLYEISFEDFFKDIEWGPETDQ